MNAYELTQQIEAVRQRADALQDHAKRSPLPPSEILHDCLEELNTALEELKVAEEEVRQQNEELIDIRAALEVERQRYKELFDFAPDAYLVTNIAGKILEANRAATNLLKISQKYLQGKLLINFIPEHQRRAFRFQLMRLHQIKQIQDWEIQMHTRRGVNLMLPSVSLQYGIAKVIPKAGVGWYGILPPANKQKNSYGR